MAAKDTGKPEAETPARPHEVDQPTQAAPTTRGPHGRRTLVLVLVVALAATTAGTGWWLGRNLSTADEIESATAPPTPSLIAVPVEAGRIEQTIAMRATLRPASTIDIATDVPDLGFEPAISYVVEVGSEIGEGDVLLAVAGHPVIVLQGELPMLRDVSLRSVGEDVLQLQQALERLGFEPGDVDGVYGSGTALAVAKLIRSAGYDAIPIKGTIAPSKPGDPAERRLVAARLPRWSVVFVKTLPAHVSATTVSRGTLTSGGTISLTRGEPTLVGTVPATDVLLLSEGAAATVTDSAGVSHPAIVEMVADVPGTGQAADGEYEFRLATEVPLDVAERISLLVRVVVAASDEDALSVPYAALTTRADGEIVVTVDVGGGEPRVVPVTTGVEAEGAVEVTAIDGNLHSGDLVVVGRQ
ncbi:MAG: peptidoglycan-binding protein [Acidimicrobiia bacterium]